MLEVVFFGASAWNFLQTKNAPFGAFVNEKTPECLDNFRDFGAG